MVRHIERRRTGHRGDDSSRVVCECVLETVCVCVRGQPQVMVRAVRVLQVSAFIVFLDVPEEINSSPAHQHIVHSTTFMNNQT